MERKHFKCLIFPISSGKNGHHRSMGWVSISGLKDQFQGVKNFVFKGVVYKRFWQIYGCGVTGPAKQPRPLHRGSVLQIVVIDFNI